PVAGRVGWRHGTTQGPQRNRPLDKSAESVRNPGPPGTPVLPNSFLTLLKARASTVAGRPPGWHSVFGTRLAQEAVVGNSRWRLVRVKGRPPRSWPPPATEISCSTPASL